MGAKLLLILLEKCLTNLQKARARASKNYKDLTENVGSTENIRLWNQIQLQPNTIAIRYLLLNLITKLIKSSTNFGTEIILDSMHLQYVALSVL